MLDGAKNGTAMQEDNGATRTRTRVSRACTRCRQRKDKCDGGTPACSNCLSADQTCSYDAATKKRGLPEGYVRAVEKLWAVSFVRINGLEDTVVQMLQQDRDLLTSIWNHREVGEELHSRWKDSRIFQDLETFLAGADGSQTTGSKRKREKDDDEEGDAVKDLAALLPPKYAVTDALDRQSTDASSSKRQAPTGSTMQLPPAASDMLGQYFKSIHSYFPILDRPRILRSCYELTRNGTQVDEDNADLAVLAAALACTARTSPHLDGSRMDLKLSFDVLLDLARQCIPTLSGTFRIGHVQALLLLALSDIATGGWESAWRSVGLAARVLTDLIDSTTTMSRDQTAARQGCLVLDTLIGIRLRRRPQCRRDDLPSTLFLREDVHEEWEPWQGTSEPAFMISCFNHLTKLVGILSDFVCQLPGTPVPARDRTDQALGNMNTLAASYPRGARLTATENAPPHQAYLKIAHLLATAFVTASHPDHVNSTIPPLAAAKKALDDIERSPANTAVMPAWLLGLFAATVYDLRQLPSGASLISSSQNEALLKGLEAHFVQDRTTVQRRTQQSHSADAAVRAESRQSVQSDSGRVMDHSPASNIVSHSRRSFFPADPFAQPMVPIQNQSPPNPPRPLGSTSDSAMFVQTPPNYWNGSIDIPTGPAGLESGGLTMPAAPRPSIGGQPMYNPSIATSPSFQGDEIDALFHEMAQLDTTEWTNGRTQGLKDFGFNDMETFEQFCNDPERLFSGNFTDPQQQQQQQQLLNQRHMSDFSMPDFVQQTQQSVPGNFDMTGSSWNG